ITTSDREAINDIRYKLQTLQMFILAESSKRMFKGRRRDLDRIARLSSNLADLIESIIPDAAPPSRPVLGYQPIDAPSHQSVDLIGCSLSEFAKLAQNVAAFFSISRKRGPVQDLGKTYAVLFSHKLYTTYRRSEPTTYSPDFRHLCSLVYAASTKQRDWDP